MTTEFDTGVAGEIILIFIGVATTTGITKIIYPDKSTRKDTVLIVIIDSTRTTTLPNHRIQHYRYHHHAPLQLPRAARRSCAWLLRRQRGRRVRYITNSRENCRQDVPSSESTELNFMNVSNSGFMRIMGL